MSAAPAAAAASGGQPDVATVLTSLLAQKRFKEVLALTQQRELEEGGVFTKESETWFAIELLAAALAQQLQTSKFVWKRVPVELKKKSVDLQTTWRLLTALHLGQFAAFYALAAQATLSLPLLQHMAVQLRDEVQARNILHIRRAYSTVSVEQASELLGTPLAGTAAFLASLQWTPDAEAPTQFFNPTPITLPKQREISHQQIHQLTSYVAHLDE